jgi:isopenicillin N synthase-like dioxygenase
MPSKIDDSMAPFPDDVPVADIYEVDFEKLSAGDKEEARKVFDASRGYGFFYLSNTHIDYQYMFDVAQETFDLPLDEKMIYEMGNQGGYFGYKMGGSNYIDDKGTPDNMEFYNVAKDDVMKIGKYKDDPLKHPDTIKRRRGELEQFMMACHKVTVVILRVLGEQLGLDPETLPNMHKLDEPSVDQARVTFASPCAADRIAFGEHTGEIHLFVWSICADLERLWFRYCLVQQTGRSASYQS